MKPLSADAARIITEVTGTPTRYHKETVGEAYACRAHYGAPDWRVDAWVSTYTAIAAGELAVVNDIVHRLVGTPAITLAEYLTVATILVTAIATAGSGMRRLATEGGGCLQGAEATLR